MPSLHTSCALLLHRNIRLLNSIAASIPSQLQCAVLARRSVAAVVSILKWVAQTSQGVGFRYRHKGSIAMTEMPDELPHITRRLKRWIVTVAISGILCLLFCVPLAFLVYGAVG